MPAPTLRCWTRWWPDRVVLDCCDNFVTRHAINAPASAWKAVGLRGRDPVRGQVAVYDPADSASPCYACVFPRTGVERNALRTMGVFAPMVGTHSARCRRRGAQAAQQRRPSWLADADARRFARGVERMKVPRQRALRRVCSQACAQGLNAYCPPSTRRCAPGRARESLAGVRWHSPEATGVFFAGLRAPVAFSGLPNEGRPAACAGQGRSRSRCLLQH